MTRCITSFVIASCSSSLVNARHANSSSLLLTVFCGSVSQEDCIFNWIYSTTGFLCAVFTSIITAILILNLFENPKHCKSNDFFNGNSSYDSILCRLAVLVSSFFILESVILHHDSVAVYLPQCECSDKTFEYLFCQIGVSLLVVMVISMLGCLAWCNDLCQGATFIFFMVTSQSITNLLSSFVIMSPRDASCNSNIQRVTRTFVMYSANLVGIILVHVYRNNMQSTDAVAQYKDKIVENLIEGSSRKMNSDLKQRQHEHGGKIKYHSDDTFQDESPNHHREKIFQQSPKHRWSRRKQHPLSSRFGTDSFLPCVVLMKKKGRSSPPVAVNVAYIGVSNTAKHHPPRHIRRRASLGIVKEQGGGGDEATWARLSQRRRTSLPTTFHSSRSQTVMSSVLVDTSVIAELHSTLTELAVATSSGDPQVDECTSHMQTLLKPYKTENLCPSQVVWLHDSVSSTSEGSDDEDNGRSRANFNKRIVNRRPEWNPDNVWTTTTSATGLPSQEAGHVKSKRLPKMQKTPSNTPHDSRCSSPTSGKEVGSLLRRRTIHSIGPLSSPGRSQSFFSQDDSYSSIRDSKDGRRMFTSSDYESCDNLLTDGSEGETVKQMPDLQQPSGPRRVGSIEGPPHDPEQSSKIRMLITEPTIDEGSEEEVCGSECSSTCHSDDGSTEKSEGNLSVIEDSGEELGPDEVKRIFNGIEYKSELLEQVYSWNFPIFELADETHCVLSQMAYKLFDDSGLFESFKIPRKPFVDYMRALENGYRNIPYHNRIHASDVLHGCWFLTTQQIPGFSEISPLFSSDSSDSDSGTAHTQVNTVGSGSLAQAIPALELMALYLAAAMHDYDHPGRTNAFLVETRHPLAMLYNDRSVLENHHASASWELLHSKTSYDFLVNLDLAEWKRLRFLIVEAILATDLKKHFELMSRFSSKIERRTDTSSEATEPLRHEGCLKWTADEDRLLVCQMVIKLADIGGPTKIRDLHVTWTQAICQEFFTQGDEERELNSPVSPFMDRKKPQVAQLQKTFIKNLIAPLVCKMHRAGILAGYAEDTAAGEEGEEDNILEQTEDGASVTCRSLIREQLADNLRYWQSVLQRDMDGQVEMDEVFECCHNVTLEHKDFDAMDLNFAKKLTEKRREKLHNNNNPNRNALSETKTTEKPTAVSKTKTISLKRSSSEPTIKADSTVTTNALCNKTREKSRLSRLLTKTSS